MDRNKIISINSIKAMVFNMLERYYPSNESFLVGDVDNKDLYGYIFHGFALVCIDGVNKYVSFDFEKKLIMVTETPEIKEIFRKKSEKESNISQFIKLTVRLNLIRIHHGTSQSSWDMVKKELVKEEFSETVANYKVTINSIIEEMFPGFVG